jgi:hypothetical protein
MRNISKGKNNQVQCYIPIKRLIISKRRMNSSKEERRKAKRKLTQGRKRKRSRI